MNPSVAAQTKLVDWRLAVLAFGLSGSGLAWLAPQLLRSVSAPLPALILVGALLSGLAILVFLNLGRFGLPLSRQTIASTLAFNLIIIAIKFVLDPALMYLNNQFGAFTVGFMSFDPNASAGYWLVAGIFFILYAAVLSVIYRRQRRKLDQLTKKEAQRPINWIKVAAILLGLSALAVITQLWFVPLLGVVFGAGYLQEVGPGFGITVIGLVAAIIAAVTAFRLAAADAYRAGSTTLLAGFFWFCLAMLLAYHIMWVIFTTMMVTIWPFKTFIPNTK